MFIPIAIAALFILALSSNVATSFGTNDPRTQRKWSKRLFKYALDNMWLTTKGFLGTGADAVIQVDKDLTKGPGDKIIFELLYPLTEAGQGDDGTIKTNHEALTIGNFTVEIHERGHSVSCAGKMSAKRTSTNLRETGKTALGIWTGEQLENDLIRALAGIYNVSGAIATVNEATPSANRRLIGGYTLAGTGSNVYGELASVTTTLAEGAQMSLQLLSLIRRKAMLATPKIRPVTVDGKPWYMVLLHPYQVKSLKNSTATNNWTHIQRDANLRGEKNPLFTGAVGVWDGMILHEYDRIPTCTGAGSSALAEGFAMHATHSSRTSDPAAEGVSFARALLLGAQAGVLGWGQEPQWHEEYLDMGNRKPAVGTDMLYGAAKTRFNQFTQPSTNTAQEDFGVFAIDTTIFDDS